MLEKYRALYDQQKQILLLVSGERHRYLRSDIVFW